MSLFGFFEQSKKETGSIWKLLRVRKDIFNFENIWRVRVLTSEI